MEWCLDVRSFSVFEMRPSCSPRSFLLVTFQECSCVVSVTRLLGACWRSLPGERNINSRVFSTKLFTKSELHFSLANVCSVVSPWTSVSLKIHLFCAAIVSNRAEQVSFPFVNMLTFHCGLKPLFLSWSVPSIPFRYFTGRFVTAVLGTLSRKAEYKALHFDY